MSAHSIGRPLWLARGVFRTASIGSGILALAQPAAAQSDRSVPIFLGKISSEQVCTLYQESAGRSDLVAGRNFVAASTSWRTWLVRDCVSNFASLRNSLASAFASSGKFVVGHSAGALVLNARISLPSGGGAAEPVPDMQQGGFAMSTSLMSVNIDFSVVDGSGRSIFGANLTKKLETGSNMSVDGFSSSTVLSGQSVYTQLQQEVALAVARSVSFHFRPLRVVSGGGRHIQLNYGAPLLKLGSNIQIVSPSSSGVAHYVVNFAGSNTATAESDGDLEGTAVGPDSTLAFVEPEDPATNGRHFQRVELPN